MGCRKSKPVVAAATARKSAGILAVNSETFVFGKDEKTPLFVLPRTMTTVMRQGRDVVFMNREQPITFPAQDATELLRVVSWGRIAGQTYVFNSR